MFYMCSFWHYRPKTLSELCDRLQGLAAQCLAQTPLMVNYTLMTSTVTLVTAGCVTESSEKVRIEFVDATVVNEKMARVDGFSS